MPIEPRQHTIACLPGDGIGPEIMDAALKVLSAVSEKYKLNLDIRQADVGGAALDSVGVPLPDATLALCKASDAVLLGAVGGPKWEALTPELRPEKGLLALRKSLGLFCNLRPVKSFPALASASPLKSITEAEPVDLLIVRELTGGIYFGEHGRENLGESTAWDVERYSRSEVTRVTAIAASMAMTRRGDLVSVDKANVLSSSQLWREVVSETVLENSQSKALKLSHMYVDNCAMQLIVNPHQFDVILTSNLFGDILSDEASTLVGSIGLMPSASIGFDIG